MKAPLSGQSYKLMLLLTFVLSLFLSLVFYDSRNHAMLMLKSIYNMTINIQLFIIRLSSLVGHLGCFSFF